MATAGVTFCDTPAVNDMPSKALQGSSGTAGVHRNVTPGNRQSLKWSYNQWIA